MGEVEEVAAATVKSLIREGGASIVMGSEEGWIQLGVGSVRIQLCVSPRYLIFDGNPAPRP